MLNILIDLLIDSWTMSDFHPKGWTHPRCGKSSLWTYAKNINNKFNICTRLWGFLTQGSWISICVLCHLRSIRFSAGWISATTGGISRTSLTIHFHKAFVQKATVHPANSKSALFSEAPKGEAIALPTISLQGLKMSVSGYCNSPLVASNDQFLSCMGWWWVQSASKKFPNKSATIEETNEDWFCTTWIRSEKHTIPRIDDIKPRNMLLQWVHPIF